jgi:DNA-binding LytR/AlgR family response regulator
MREVLMDYGEYNKRRILIVDDERAIRENMYEILDYTMDKKRHSDRLTELENKIFSRVKKEEDDDKTQFELALCSQGEEAVEAVKKSIEEKKRFSVIFIDYVMPPGISGEETAYRIRKMDPDVYIVFITGYAHVDPETIAKRVPPKSKLFYIEKPLHRKELVQMATSLSENWVSDMATEELLNTLKDEISELEEENKRYN